MIDDSNIPRFKQRLEIRYDHRPALRHGSMVSRRSLGRPRQQRPGYLYAPKELNIAYPCGRPASSKICTIRSCASLTASSALILPDVTLAIIWLGIEAAITASIAALGSAG